MKTHAKPVKHILIPSVLAVVFCATVASGAPWNYSGTGSWLPSTSYMGNGNPPPGASAVPMEAIASESPAQIMLKIYSAPTSTSYDLNISGVYDIFRKDPNAKSWGAPIGTVTVGTNITTWIDSNVVAGQMYEYGLAPAGTTTFRFGNVLAGIKVDRTLPKGHIAIVVADDIPVRLPVEYAQYKADLVKDGWMVDEIVVPRAPDYLANGTGTKDINGVPTGPFPTNHIAVRNQIQALYSTYSNELKNVVLLGKVPVARSGVGYVGPDGHGNRSACGADAYYADMDGVWTDAGNNLMYYSPTGAVRDAAVSLGTINIAGDNKFDADDMAQLTPNANLELGFGRIDFSARISGEYESTRTYFNKLHRYKTASPDFLPGRRAIMRGSFGVITRAYLAAMPGVLGMTNLDYIVNADLPAVPSTDYDDDSDYTKTNGPYLFYFKGSAGPGYSDGGRAVFWTGMQSHWGYWFEPAYSSGQTRMQQRLAEDNFCLSFTWYIGNYGWDCSYLYHRLGMGGDAGDMMRASMSDRNSASSLYLRTDSPMFMDHMGDPALRLFMFAPPTGLQVWKSGGTPALAWTASVAPANEPPVIGYHVYRSASSAGPFARLTSSYLTGTNYTDATVSSGKWYYQVKAVRLETTGGGTFYNTSLATQQEIDLTNGPDPLSVDTNSALPGANSNTTYQATLAAIGGTPTFTWTVVSNSLPPGLSLSPAGIFFGKPTQAGIFDFTVQATDLLGQTAQAQRSITVQPADLRTFFVEAGAYVSKSSPTYIARYYEPGIQILGGPSYVLDGLLRFDLSSIPVNRTIVRAKLILSVDGMTPLNSPVVVQAALTADAGDNWSELTACYNNEPADNIAVPTVTALSNAVPYGRLSLDVTGMAAATLGGDPNRKLGIRLFSATPGGFGQAAQICYSHANRLARPQLVVETSDAEPPPFASFTASPASGEVPLPVSFNDISTGTITNRFWNFGDGVTTNTASTNITHTFTSIGTNAVQLIVSGPLGVSTNTQAIIVTPPSAPAAGFTASPTNGAAPLTVSFNDTSTGSITNRFWDFGDGTTTNITATGIAHTYVAAGTYTVQLIATGSSGVSTNAQVNSIIVTAPAAPTAGFSATPTSGYLPLLVAFTDTSTGSITNRFWSFGDGATTNTISTSVSHTYTSAGTNTVQLIVSGPAGASTNTQANLISAETAPIGNLFIYDPFNDAPSSTAASSNTIPAGWVADSVLTNSTLHGTVVSGSLTYPGLATGQGNSFGLGNKTADYFRNFSPTALTAGQTVYFSYLVRFNAGMQNNKTTGMGSIRLYDTNDISGGGVTIGFGAATGTTSTLSFSLNNRNVGWGPTQRQTPENYTFQNTTYLLVGAYTLGTTATNGSLRLWVNPDSSSFGTATPPAATLSTNSYQIDPVWNRLQIKSDGSGSWPASWQIDELRIGPDWASVVPSASAPVSAPVITSTLSATGTVNRAFSYQITADNSPVSFDATGLPTGLSVNTNSGAITGTPTVAGSNDVTISASNAGGTDSKTLAVVISSAAPVTDSNGNGIPDSWEVQYFGGVTNINPASLAANGINTMLEAYIAGLNPTNPTARLNLSIQPLAAQKLFQWQAVSGRVYSVYWATNLLNGFQPLETNIVWPQSSWTDTVHGAQGGGFYRINVQMGQ